MARLDARSDALRVDGHGGTRTTGTSAPIAQHSTSAQAPQSLTERETEQVRLAKLRAAEYDRQHGTTTRVYCTFEYRDSERIGRDYKRETYTRRIVHIHTVRETPEPVAIETPEPPYVAKAPRLMQDRARLEAIAARLAKYRD